MNTSLGNKNLSIAIIGAGIGGMTAALALRQAGFSPTVFEQAPELGEVGAGLSLSPNAVKALDHLGLGDFLTAHANEPLTQWTRHGETNEDLVKIDRHPCRDQYGAPYLQIHRADFHAELVRRFESECGEALRLGKTLVGIENDSQKPVAIFDGGERVEADVIIGADGIRSVTREALFDDRSVEFTGHMAWRGLIPAENLPSFFSQAASHVWVGPGLNFVAYPIRRGAIVNFVAFSQAESWVEESWSAKAEPGALKALFANWCEPVQTVLGQLNERECYRWGLFSRNPLPVLYKGRIGLIGDAAHPMLPYFGQGASSAIEDGLVMARCFAASASADEALRRYNASRLERVTTLQRESNLGGERLHGLNPYDLRDKPLKNEDALGIFRYNPVTAPI